KKKHLSINAQNNAVFSQLLRSFFSTIAQFFLNYCAVFSHLYLSKSFILLDILALQSILK
ncbi:TPA: hypothetical protein ACG689_002127, partial [Streptococcus agalactiae]